MLRKKIKKPFSGGNHNRGKKVKENLTVARAPEIILLLGPHQFGSNTLIKIQKRKRKRALLWRESQPRKEDQRLSTLVERPENHRNLKAYNLVLNTQTSNTRFLKSLAYSIGLHLSFIDYDSESAAQ